MSFSLYRRPGTVVFLDDDPDYLEMLGEVMPPAGMCACSWAGGVHRPAARDILNRRPMPGPSRKSSAAGAKAPLIPQVLAYWGRRHRRYALSELAVVDYSMPGMDGLQALGE